MKEANEQLRKWSGAWECKGIHENERKCQTWIKLKKATHGPHGGMLPLSQRGQLKVALTSDWEKEQIQQKQKEHHVLFAPKPL